MKIFLVFFAVLAVVLQQSAAHNGALNIYGNLDVQGTLNNNGVVNVYATEGTIRSSVTVEAEGTLNIYNNPDNMPDLYIPRGTTYNW